MPDNTSSIIPIGGGGSGSATNITIGTTTVTGGGTNRVLYEDSAQKVAASSSFTMDGTQIESILQTNISGPDATTNVEIGSVANDANAGTGGFSVAIGNAANNSANGSSNIILASGSGSSISGTASGSVVIGNSSSVTGAATNAYVLGESNTSAGSNSLTFGRGLTGAANAFVAGTAASGFNNVYFGKGITSTSAVAYTINGTGGSGADNAGGAINIAGGIATGTGAGGDVNTQTSARSTTSSTPQTLVTRQAIVAGTKTLTAGAATNVVRIGVPQGLTGPVGVTIFYAVRAADAADFQLRRGSVHIAAVNKAGTETAVISAASEVLDGSVLAQSSASTLTYALTVGSNAADTVDFMINAVSGLTETTLDVSYQVLRDHGAGTITPQ